MMSSLSEYCALIYEIGLPVADKLIDRFEDLVCCFPELHFNENSHIEVVKSFYFSVWAIANGVWSNIQKTKIRRALMSESKQLLIITLSRKLYNSYQVFKLI